MTATQGDEALEWQQKGRKLMSLTQFLPLARVVLSPGRRAL
jgi:hypothetical protein